MILNQLRTTIIVLLLPFIANATENNLIGSTSDRDNSEPLAFVNVFFEGTDIGTTTNKNGYFSISAIYLTSGNHTLDRIHTFLLCFIVGTYFCKLQLFI